MTRPFIPPARPLIGEEEISAVARVMRTGMIAQGPQVEAFEEEFARQIVPGTRAIALNSGTSALHLGLLAAGIGPGDEVIVPSFTFAATANAVAITGATPVFADIDPLTFTLSPASVSSAVSARARAIMPVHLYGHPAPLDTLDAIARERGLMLFEDAAQAHGASLHGRPVGSFGTFAAFSFYPTKNMTSGEGGMVTSRDPALVRWVRLARNQGMEKRYENEIVGLNNRMTDIHAAIGRVQLTKIDAWTAERQSNAAYLSAHLRGVTVPHVAPGATHVFHQYTIRVPQDRDGFARALREEYGIGSGVYYPIPAHELASLARFAPDTDLPATRAAAAEVLSLPVYPSLTRGDLDRIVEAVNALAEAGA